MTRFLIGLLLGLLLGIAGTSAFLITAGGGDYFVAASPRVRELETALKNADTDREWLRRRLTEANDVMARLESRFVALSARFEALVDAMPSAPAGARHGAAEATAGADAAGAAGAAAARDLAESPAPTATGAPSRPTPQPTAD